MVITDERLLQLRKYSVEENLLQLVQDNFDTLASKDRPSIFARTETEEPDVFSGIGLEWVDLETKVFASIELDANEKAEVYIHRSIYDSDEHEDLTFDEALAILRENNIIA